MCYSHCDVVVCVHFCRLRAEEKWAKNELLLAEYNKWIEKVDPLSDRVTKGDVVACRGVAC